MKKHRVPSMFALKSPMHGRWKFLSGALALALIQSPVFAQSAGEQPAQSDPVKELDAMKKRIEQLEAEIKAKQAKEQAEQQKAQEQKAAEQKANDAAGAKAAEAAVAPAAPTDANAGRVTLINSAPASKPSPDPSAGPASVVKLPLDGKALDTNVGLPAAAADPQAPTPAPGTPAEQQPA